MNIKALIITSVVALALTGCAGTNGNPVATTPTGTNAQTPTPTTETPLPEPVVTEETTEPVTETLKFGKTFTWENGLSATVSAPKLYRPTDTAAGTEGFTKFVVFTVTIVNKTGGAFDPAMIQHSVQSSDVEGSQVFDGLNMPETKILNGRQAKYKVPFGVTNPTDIIFELTPGFEYNSAIWTK